MTTRKSDGKRKVAGQVTKGQGLKRRGEVLLGLSRKAS